RIDPGALAERPTESRGGIGLPTIHLDDAILDIELHRADEPGSQLAERQPVAHRHWPCADEGLPTVPERQPFDGPANRIGPVQHPHLFSKLRRGFENITQRRDERIDATT